MEITKETRKPIRIEYSHSKEIFYHLPHLPQERVQIDIYDITDVELYDFESAVAWVENLDMEEGFELEMSGDDQVLWMKGNQPLIEKGKQIGWYAEYKWFDFFENK